MSAESWPNLTNFPTFRPPLSGHAALESRFAVPCPWPSDVKKSDRRRERVSWFHNGTVLEIRPEQRGKLPAYFIRPVTWQDAGLYTCRIVLPTGQVRWTNTTVVVVDEPDVPKDHKESVIPDFDMAAVTSRPLQPGTRYGKFTIDRLIHFKTCHFIFPLNVTWWLIRHPHRMKLKLMCCILVSCEHVDVKTFRRTAQIYVWEWAAR